MRKSSRRGQGDRQSRALSLFGNLLLLLATLGVGVLVAYLIVSPPGVVDASDRVSLPQPTTPSATTAAPTSTSAAAGSSAVNLDSSCAAVTPLLDTAETTLAAAVDDPASLTAEGISALSASLASALSTAPGELATPTQPLTQVLIDLNSSVLAGEDPPTVDSESGNSAIAAARAVCTG